MSILRITALGVAITLGSTAAFAEAHAEAVAAGIEARQAHMKSYGGQLRTLSGMARGEVAYDAAAASEAAAKLLELASVDQTDFWVEGSDNFSTDIETRALPMIWEDMEGFEAKKAALIEAATALNEVAGNGQEALGPAMGPVGAVCGACHETYRAPEE